MSNDWFFEKFALISDAPGAVERMRGLVLQLAVHGKLVPQDPSDEPAEKLCEPDEELSSGSLSEVPLGWILTRLEQLAEINGGFAFKSTAYTEEGTRVVRISDFDEFGFKDHKVVRHSFSADFHKFTLKEQNILMAMTGGTVGKSYLVRFMPEPMVVNQRVATIKVLDSAMPRYIDIVIRSKMTQEVIREAKNSTNDNISMSDIKGFRIPLPPLAEQKRIVAKVDELLGICDALEAQQRERESRKSVLVRASLSRFAESPTPENLGYLFHKSYDIAPSELRKSILTLAVQGKLVPFDIASTKKTVGEHIDFQNGFAFKSQWFTTNGTRLCRNANVSHGFLDWKESVFVDEKLARDFQRFALCEGDIVLSLDRPLIATGLKAARVRQEDLPSLLLQRVARLTPTHDQLSRSYIFLWLNSTAFVDCIDPGRSNGVPHISTRQVQQLDFSIPPLAQQHRIVAKVDQLMALIDELERQQGASREKASKLLDAIVQEMTSGGRDIAATLES